VMGDLISFRPSGEVEQWHILRADVAGVCGAVVCLAPPT
jgi:hypothetical protein